MNPVDTANLSIRPCPCAELKSDAKGKKEFEDYRTKLLIQRADLVNRIDKNKTWIVSCCITRSLPLIGPHGWAGKGSA